MIVFLNGQFVPEERAVVSVFDRSFLYGDGLFETLAVFAGQPFRWEQHFARLARGAEFLGISLTYSVEELLRHAPALIAQNRMPEATLRITLSRGVGIRGYSPKGANCPLLVMALHAPPPKRANALMRWQLMTASFRLPANEPLAAFKTCNKLPQILARAEAEAQGADEALLLNTKGEVAEAASSNLFWIEAETVCTTPLASGILAGVTREFVLELCATLGLRVQEKTATVETIRKASGAFLTLSTLGIVEVETLDATPLASSPLVPDLHRAYYATALNLTD